MTTQSTAPSPQDFRPSPYRTDRSFRFSVGIFKFFGAFGLVFGAAGLGISLAMLAGGLPERAIVAIGGSAYLLLGGAVFAGLSFLLSMLADIEQHTFRAAQQLNRIVESQTRKKTNAS